jgi:hypothetical protein
VAHECPVHGVPSFGFRCCYADLKIRARQGEPLSPEELAFVGYAEQQRPTKGGWHAPGTRQFEVDDTLSDEDSAMLSALMDVPRQDQIEFMNADWL